MSSRYPGEFDLFETKKNATSQSDPAGDYVMAEDVNDIQDSITSIEHSLGKDPQGSHLTVSDRIAGLEGVQALRTPSILVYLGSLSEINGATSTDEVAGQLVKLDHIVIGNDAQSPISLDHEQVKVIIQKTKAIKGVKFYGYIDISILTETLSEIQVKINQWIALGVDGIYLDNMGYDKDITRTRQNDIVASVHQYNLPVIFNASNSDDVFLDIFHATLNPNRIASSAEAGDAYHFNTFGVNTSDGAVYIPVSTVLNKLNKLYPIRSTTGVKIFATATISSSTMTDVGQTYFDYAEALAVLSSLDAFYAVDTEYSIVTDKAPFYEQVSVLGQWYVKDPVINNTSGIYSREASFGKVTVDSNQHTWKYSGASVPTNLLRAIPDSLDGLVIKNGTIDDAKIGSYSGSRLVGAINTSIAFIKGERIEGLMDPNGGITEGLLRVNVISAINASIGNAVIAQAKIGDLDASKITAGTIAAGRISASVVSAINLYAATAEIGYIRIGHAAIGELTVEHIKASVVEAINLNATTAVIAEGKIANLSAEKITAGHIAAERMRANIINAINLYAEQMDVNSALINTATIGVLSANHMQVAVLSAINASVENIVINKAKIGQLDASNIEANAITAEKIAAEAVTAEKIQAEAIIATKIKAGAVTTEKLDALAVTAEKIAANTITAAQIAANTLTANEIAAGAITASEIAAGVVNATHIGANQIESNHIAANQILAGHIAADQINAGHILANAIQTKHIQADAVKATQIAADAILARNIKAGEVKTTHLAADAITATLIRSVVIEAINISATNATIEYINGQRILVHSIEADQIKAGTITSVEIQANSILGDRIRAGAITADHIAAGTINSDHITTGGLDALKVTLYNGETGEVLIGAGYIRVNGLDAGVVQSDNLAANGLFMTASSSFGFRRDNPPGEAIVGAGLESPGGNQIWKIDLTTDTLMETIDIPGKKPAFMAIDNQTLTNGDKGKYGYVTVQGDDTVIQIDLEYGIINDVNTLSTGKGPGRIKYYGDILGDMKHFFMVNTDRNDVNAPDSFYILDAPPTSNDADGDGIRDFYIHHQLITGNMPYDFVLDPSTMKVFITVADQGDILILDANKMPTYNWAITGAIPISEFGTDNYHGGLGAGFGAGYSNGGSSSKNYSMNHGGSGMGGMAHVHGGYGAPAGDLRTYSPHGIDLSTDKQFLLVADNANGQLLIVYKTPLDTATAPPVHVHSAPAMSIMAVDPHTGHDMGTPGEVMFNYGAGTVATQFVKFRIHVGSAPEIVKLVNGKIFVSIFGQTQIAVIDESELTATIVNGTGATVPKHIDGLTIPVRYIEVGSKPLDIIADPTGAKLYVSLNGSNEVVRIDVATETVTKRFSTGANVMGLAISPDGKHLYTVNNGGTGSFSFVYPKGGYIGDAYIGLEGGVKFQGAQFWTPYRTDWTYYPDGRVKSYSVVEFHINEPLLNEGGYARLTTVGDTNQMAYIEQDVTGVTNFSDGDNFAQVVAEQLSTSPDRKSFAPKRGWLESFGVTNIRVANMNTMGIVTYIIPDPGTYTVYFNANPRVAFNVPIEEGQWVVADYTFVENVWHKAHNGSVLVAIENSSSSNFNTYFEVDEFVPKFISIDNQQTEPFTYSPIELPAETNANYTGLEYSIMTKRSIGAAVSSSITPTVGNLISITDGTEPADSEEEATGTYTPGQMVEFPSGLQSVTIDMGKAYMIGKVVITHAFHQPRIYHNTKTEVSEDRVNWTTIYDSAVSGEYREHTLHPLHNHRHYGKVISFNAKAVRYIRDWTNGYALYTVADPVLAPDDWVFDSEHTENHWTEIHAYGDWEVEAEYFHNYALKLPQSQVSVIGEPQNPTWGDGKKTDLSLVVDGTMDTNLYFSAGLGIASIQLDLGSVKKIDTIKVWHFYGDVRKYRQTKTDISVDGIAWTTVFDSAVLGEYYETPAGNTIQLGGLTDVRYIRDSTNGCLINDSLTDPENRWIQIQAYDGYKDNYEYRYPSGSDNAGQNLATNGRCFISTNIAGAYVAVDLVIDFTSWWYMTYIRGPQFGMLAVEMPTAMGGSHSLPQDYTYITKEAHRHIMSFPPSSSIKEYAEDSIKAGKHRAVLKQQSGRVSLDRLRFEDYQKYKTSRTVIPYNSSKTFVRYKLIPEQGRTYIGRGNQSTDGAYDTRRINPFTKLPDNSVPLKYRMRVKSELTPIGNASERGIAYVTSTIFETGRNSTHWRRSEAADLIPGNRIEPWDGLQPHTTGIQWFHLANGAVRGTKILPHAIMDYHISPYAKIGEFKLNLNYPTHGHGHYMTMDGVTMWHDNKADLDMVMGWGTSGTSNLIAHADHVHLGMLQVGGTPAEGLVPVYSSGVAAWGNLNWNAIVNRPTTFVPSVHSHVVADITDLPTFYYNKSEVDALVAGAPPGGGTVGGDVYKDQANTFSQLNTFNKAGTSILIYPATEPAANTILFQMKNLIPGWAELGLSGEAAIQDIATIDSEGDMYLSGRLTVSGNLQASNVSLTDLTITGNVSTTGVLTLGAQATLVTHAVRADRLISAGIGLTGGGDLTANRTLAVDFNQVAAKDHVHNNYLTNGSDQQVGTNFSVRGTFLVGASQTGNTGDLIMYSGAGVRTIHLDGGSEGNTNPSTIKIYMSGDGSAVFSNSITAKSLVLTDIAKPLVPNLNAELLNGKQEFRFAKNDSIREVSGYGIQTGFDYTLFDGNTLTLSPAPTMLKSVAYTSSGRRSDFDTFNQPVPTNGASSGDIYYVLYVKGPSQGQTEGQVAYIGGTLNGGEPPIDTDAVKLYVIRRRSGNATISNADVTDARRWKGSFWDELNNRLHVQTNINVVGSVIEGGKTLVNKYASLGTSATPVDNLLYGKQTIQRVAGTILSLTDGTKTLNIKATSIDATAELAITTTGNNAVAINTNVSISSGGYLKASKNATKVTIPKGSISATWTHNYGSLQYAVAPMANSAKRHVSYQNLSVNTIDICIDEIADQDIDILCILIAY